MKKTKLALIISSIFFIPQFGYADMIVEGTTDLRSRIEDKQPDAEGYYHFNQDIQIGPGTFGKITVNNGTKIKTGEIHVGNHGNGDGTLIVDGIGTKVEIIDNRLNVGGSGSRGQLYIRNGAELIQSHARNDDNYFGYHGGTALISVEGQGSRLVFNLGRQGFRSVSSNIYLKDGATLEINDQPAYLPHLVNYGNVISKEPLTITRYLQIGNDDGTKAGSLNLAGGISLWGKLVVNKLAEPKVTLPINDCYGCTIEHNAPETLVLFKNNPAGITTHNLTINKGTVSIEDQTTFDTFKANTLNLAKDGTFSLTNIGKTETNLDTATEFKADTFVHLGKLDLADGTANPKLTEFTVGNYTGGGELLVDTVWNQDPQTSSSDVLHIKGRIAPNTVTTVKTKSGIIGDIRRTIEDQFSPAVVKVDTEHDGNLFTGSAETTGAGEAQLTKKDGNYYWTLRAMQIEQNGSGLTVAKPIIPIPEPIETVLPSTPAIEAEAKGTGLTAEKPIIPVPVIPTPIPTETVLSGAMIDAEAKGKSLVHKKPVYPMPVYVDIISKSVVGYLQQPFINRQMGLSQLGKLHERVGEQRTLGWDNTVGNQQLWARVNYDHTGLQGKNRFGANVKSGFVQFGRDVHFKLNEDKSQQHTGLTFTYGWANSKFFDKYRAENGIVISDKFTGTAKTDMISLGGYHTYYSPTGAYVDLVGQVSWLDNRYNSYGKRAKQNGYGLGLSIEVGKPFALLNPQITVEPQAQLTYQGIWLNGFNDGVKQIQRTQQDSLVGRLGVRVNWSKALEQNSPQFYFTANLLQTLKGRESKITVGRQQVKEAFGDLAAEFGVGGQYPITKNLSLYGDVRYVLGIQDRNKIHRNSTLSRQSYNAHLGVRYTW